MRLWFRGRELPVGSPQQQVVLAALVLRGQTAISTDDLITAVWGESPPLTALGTIRTYISRLRRLLEGTATRIDAVAGGYAMRGPDLGVDAWDLQRAISESNASESLKILGAAVDVWAGTALEGVPGSWAEGQRARLDGLRVAGVQIFVRAQLKQAGLTRNELHHLAGLVADHPLDEDLRALLMLALHRQGRRTEALAVFQEGMTILRDELGLSPGSALQSAQNRVLQEGSSPKDAAEKRVSHLPARIPDFIGREYETALLRMARNPTGITGLGGSGRTSLAVQAAHLMTQDFPDGQVYCDLTEAGGVDEVLEHLLLRLGAPAPVPSTLHARATALSIHTSHRQLMVIVDNVRTAEEVQVLRQALPSAKLVFIGLRQFHQLADVTWVSLRALPLSDSLAVFAAVAGQDRINQSAEASRELAALSGGHALAVRIFAQRLRDLQRWSVAAITQHMSEEMSDPYPAAHDDCHMLAAPVERSYSSLPSDSARVMRVLGVLPDRDHSVEEVAALLGLPAHQVFFALTACADASLLIKADDDLRYRLAGPVVRTVMMRLAHAIDGTEAVDRLRAAHAL